MFELLKDLLAYIKVSKKYWLLPIMTTLLLLGGLIVVGSGSSVAPFIYAIF